MKSAFFLALCAAMIPVSFAAEFYVSPRGDDSNPGTKEKPFASFERARDQIRSLRSQGGKGGRGFTVWITGGDYYRTNAFELNSKDSGQENAVNEWRVDSGATARLLGGNRLSGFAPVTEASLLERLSEPARGQVQQIDLVAIGITRLGEMKSRGFGRSLGPAHCELFYGGAPMTLARWPNEGAWETIAGFPDDKAQKDGHGGNIGQLQAGFFYKGDRPRRWREPSDLWVHGYWAWDWANSYERVTGLDLEKRHIRTAPPHGLYGFRKGQRFYFLNVLEELDQPGEWFLDRTNGKLYFWPPDGNHPAKEILLSLSAEPLLRLRDVSYVTFRGLRLEATRSSAVEIHAGQHNRIAGCTIRNIGNYGVVIAGGTRHQVLGCDILDTGDGGVTMDGGDRQTLAGGEHLVENCYFARQGRWSKCYVPAVLMGGVGLRVAHNLIEQHPHCAILFNGNNHTIEFNEIRRIALETGDVGAIYTGRDYTYRGNRIRYNYIHHTGGVGMGSMGVYMDDCVSGTEIAGNIFYKVQRAAFLGGGRDHQVRNNIFVECNHAVELDGRGLDGSPVWHDMVDKFMRQRLADVPSALYRERYPELKTLDTYYGPPGGPPKAGAAFKGVPPENNVVAQNVCVGKWLNVYWHATPEMLLLENNLTNAAASFARTSFENATATDFALKSDSPAWSLGFKPIPARKIGLYRDENRANAAPSQTD